MRNPNRIPKVLNAFQALWETCPDMRFFQLIEFVKGMEDLFYLEDDKAINLFYQKITQISQMKGK